MNGYSDADVIKALRELDVGEDAANELVYVLDQSGVTSESNSKPTAMGWSSVLVAVSITVVTAYVLVQLFQPIVIKAVFVAISVAAGFAAHVAVSYCMEKVGVKMSRVVPVEIPDASEIKRRLDALS